MKLFNRLLGRTETDNAESTNEPENSTNPAESANFGESASKWESLQNADSPEDADIAVQQEQDRLAEQERQERKLIGAFAEGVNVLSQEDYAPSHEKQEVVYRALADSEIDTDAKSRLLQRIATPLQRTNKPDNVLASIDSKHERRILAYISGVGFDNWQNVTISDLTRTQDNFPTPYELAEKKDELLSKIAAHNSPEKFQQYVKAMDGFEQKFYGKRFEYYQALESLQGKAERHVAEQNSRDSVLAAYHKGDTEPATIPNDSRDTIHVDPRNTIRINTEPITERIPQPAKPQEPESYHQPSEKVTVHYLDAKESKKILKRSKIDGDSFYYNGQEYDLTPEILEHYGLAPAYGFELQNAKINLSKPFQLGSHTAMIGYVTTGKQTNVCSYYRSNSQGIWRYLPDYVASADPREMINWFGKGYDEESLNLPNASQYALELITNTQEKADLNPVQASHAFAGTAKRYSSRDEYSAIKYQHALRGEHYQEIPDSPSFNLGHVRREKSPPDTLDLTGNDAPDFKTSVNPYRTSTSLYGPISVEGVRSKNDRLEYTFNRNNQGQAWLSHIEITDAPISSHGLRTAWATAGDFGTPLYEYHVQDGGYGDHSDRHHNYVNMWKNYLSRMPLIQKYLNSRHANR